MSLLRITNVFFFVFSISVLHGQIQLTDATVPPYNINNLITNVFLGSGVEVTGISYTGSPKSAGFFSGGFETIGLERGIVLTTGEVNSIDNLNETSDDSGEQTTGSINQDNDLEALAGNSINDISMYTISFIPTADTLRFNYVFASEEYPEYVCSINDVFGFFVTGPNPSGGMYNAENIALVPDPSDPSGLTFTNIPVTINNVHNGVKTCTDGFSNYYNPVEIGNPNFQMNAYLDVFTAEVIVVPCEEYTIKLGVADASDQLLNSAVFLEAKSFGTGTLAVSVNSLSLDGSLAEGCGVGTLDFNLPRVVSEDLSLDFELLSPSNSATPGVDYPELPDEITIPAGSKSISIPLEAYIDTEIENEEVIQFALQVDFCNRDTFTIILRDDQLYAPLLPDDVTICEGDSLLIESELNPIFTVPPPPIFSSSQKLDISPELEAVYSDIEVNGVIPTILTPNMIESVCITNLEHRQLDDLDIFLIAPGGQFLELTTDNGFKANNIADVDYYRNTCFTPFASEKINNGNNLAGPIFDSNPTYTGEFAPEGIWSDLWDGNYPSNGTWRLLIIDDFNGVQGFLEGWSITFRSFYNLEYEWTSDNGVVDCINCEDIKVRPSQKTTYTLKLIDSYGCEREESINVAVAPSLEKPNVSCGSITQNSIEVNWNAIANSIGYEARLNGGSWIDVGSSLNHNFTNLLGDTDFTIEFRALGTDCNSLIDTLICTTLPCAAPMVTIGDITPTSCPGGEDGQVVITATGTFPPFNFSIGSESNTDGFFTSVIQGDNTVQVTDSDNCRVEVSFEMLGPPDFELTSSYDLTEPCDITGNINGNISVEGGSGPYTYLWEDGTADKTIFNISTGEYMVTITDAKNCQVKETLFVPSLSVFDFDINTTPPLCKGEANGAAAFELLTGNRPFDITWPDGTKDSINLQLEEGSYEVTVTDDLRCTIVKDFVVTEGAVLTAELTLNNVTCKGLADGAASATITGGEGPYQYFWDGGTSNGNITENLGPGNYTLFVEDKNACRYNESFMISEPDGMSFEYDKVDNLCNGSSDASISIVASSPNGDVEIVWNDGNDQFARSGLISGEYCFSLSDGTSCTRDSCIIISEPEVISATENISNPKCASGNDGSITIMVSGGMGTYDFNWNGPIASLPNSNAISGLITGNYSLTITDENNCSSQFSWDLNAGAEIEVDTLVSEVSCFGESTGSIEFNASGGNGDFTYQWNGPDDFFSEERSINNLISGEYFLTFSDAAGCTNSYKFYVDQPETGVSVNISDDDLVCHGLSNGSLNINPTGGSGPYSIIWSNGFEGVNNIDLEPGDYAVTVTDSRMCAVIAERKVEEQDEIRVVLKRFPSLCFGTGDGRAEVVTISYGSEEANINDFNYLWNSSPIQNGPTAEDLNGGAQYTVVVTDNNGCTQSASTEIESPEAVSAETLALSNVKCFQGNDGTLEIQGIGGDGDYGYLWDANAGNATTPSVGNLSQGGYNVTISDGNGCQGVKTFTIEQPRPLSMDFRILDVLCHGESTGRAEGVVEGGVPPYSFEWSNGARTKAIEDVISEQYNITVTDENGCILYDSTRVNEPKEPILVDFQVENVSCFDVSNGKIEINASGGSGFYQYSADGNSFSSTNVISNLSAGSYDIFTRDFKGCIDTISDIVVTQPNEIIVDLGQDKIIPFGSTTIINPEIYNAIGNLNFQWLSSNLDLLSCTTCVNPTFNGQREASFELLVYDSNGCQGRDFVSIRLENFSPLFVPSAFTPNGDGENDILLIFGRGIKEVRQFKIYDRWGEMVYELAGFEPNDESTGWDGTFRAQKSPSGLYYWFAEVEFINGFEETYNGNVTLLR